MQYFTLPHQSDWNPMNPSSVRVSPSSVRSESELSPSSVWAQSEFSLSSVRVQSKLSPSSVRVQSELNPIKDLDKFFWVE